jgi:uncharacterized membrane protein YfcA
LLQCSDGDEELLEAALGAALVRPLAIPELISIALLGLTSGLMIGCIGIGGVILVPSLLFLANVPIRIAIPAAVAAYILSGIVATTIFARHKSIRWSMAVWLCAGAAPAAFAGAWTVSVVDPRILEACIGLLTFFSGLNSLRRRSGAEFDAAFVSNKTLLTIGTTTGFLSSISGTGGPLVLVPVLITLRLPVLTAVGLSQAIQLPVAIAATAGNIIYGRVNPTLAIILAAALTVGSWCGARLAHVVPRQILRRIVSVVLVAIGTLVLGNVGWRLLH